MLKVLTNLLDSNEKQLKKLWPTVEQINALEPKIEKLSDKELQAKTEELRERIQGYKDIRIQRTLDEILPEAFAVVREASKRVNNERHFDVQLLAGIVLHQGKIAEQKTGEGKTLSATLPLYLNSLLGKGCHLVTVNDYLARRDCGWMGPIYHLLGLSCAAIIHERSFIYDPSFTDEKALDKRLSHLRPISRKEAYLADITYGTNNEFGFDYLRDNMVTDLSQMVQRAHYFAIVDEVDFLLVDEARTPLIISAPAEEAIKKYYDFAALIQKLVRKTDYTIDEKSKTANLTELGIRKVEKMLGVKNLYEKDFETIHHIEQALKAKTLFKKDHDYVVKDEKVIIVDEFTGRLMFGRRYSEGLHQALEAKEGVPIQKESKTLATISFQNYFRMYEKLAGMTGTAATEAEEFEKIYGLEVVIIPTNEPMIRADHPDVVYKTEAAKFRAVVQEIEECHKRGQPVLLGTTSIENNELLGKLLKRRGIPHQILNAKHHEKEAYIIAQAGHLGGVTVATNMAGRGVDIKLGGDPPKAGEYEKVKELGGLHVVGTERHESRRIDNQLRGRAGRQGDSGSSRFFVSLQDDLMRIFGGETVERIMDRFGLDENIPLEHKMVSRSIEQAQKRVEGHNFDIRKHLVEYDDVMNKQREVIYGMRRRMLEAGGLKLEAGKIKPQTSNLKQWLLNKLSPYADNIAEIWKEKQENLSELWPQIVKAVSLQVIDTLWMEHLTALDDLREGIGLRGYAQKDPLVEYKKEARLMFERLVENIYGTIAERLAKIEIEPAKIEIPEEQRRTLVFQHKPSELGVRDEALEVKTLTRQGKKVGRNDPCPCGSGKKYKKCCWPKYG